MISPALSQQILQAFGLRKKEPSAPFLDEILHAYIRKIPWESATRNIKRVATADLNQCPRWPEEFWELALASGTGGTCFETNLAAFVLLQSLGFDGYLTINNMTRATGCHTAIVVLLDGHKWLFDAGYPLHRTIPLASKAATHVPGKFIDFQANPMGDGTYEIMRTRHPKPYIFTLIDTPISIGDYKRATINDYRPEGNFNNSVVINKIVDERMVRFSTWPEDVQFEAFTADPDGGMAVQELFEIKDNLPQQLAEMFGMPEDVLAQALKIVKDDR